MLYKIAEKIYELESQGKKIVRMNVGEPMWPTPKEVREASIEEIKDKDIRYGSSSGVKDFRKALAEMHEAKLENIVVEPGSKYGIFSLMHLLLRNQGEVMLFSPHWTAYEGMAKSVGGKFKKLELNLEEEWKIDVDKVNEECSKDTKLFIINNPCNPTSYVWDEKTEKAIKEIAEDNGAQVLLDDAYRSLTFGENNQERKFEGGEILVESFSKSLMMSGWRLGYIVTNKELCDRLTKLNQITITNVPEFIQHGAMNALPKRKEIAEELRKRCEESAEVAYKSLKENGFLVVKPKAGFYIFPNLGVDGMKVAEKLLEKGYAIVPGAAFGNYKNHVRISICHPREVVKDCMENLASIVEELKR